MVSLQFQNSYGLFYCTQEVIRNSPRHESLQRQWCDIGSDHFLTLAKLRFSQKYLHFPGTPHAKKIYFVMTFDCWLTEEVYDSYTNRIRQKLQEFPESSNIILEWKNIRLILSHAADESWTVDSRTRWRETKKIQTKLAMTCNRNEQQQGAKNNVELQTKWKKTTGKAFEKSVRRGRKRSVKA
jgi:hypothetical protein